MSTVLLVAGSVFVGIAALFHVFVFYLESIAWSKPSTWKGFGVKTQADADTLRPMAYNQGYYNAFLALGALIGLVMIASLNLHQAGIALTGFSGLSMVLAATVLVTSNRRMVRAALLQGVTPLIGILLLGLSVIVKYR